MTVHVTQFDIDTGMPKSVHFCPVARALERETKRIWMVKNHYAYPTLSLENPVHLPEEVQEFVSHYDTGWPVFPFSFELDWEVEA